MDRSTVAFVRIQQFIPLLDSDSRKFLVEEGSLFIYLFIYLFFYYLESISMAIYFYKYRMYVKFVKSYKAIKDRNVGKKVLQIKTRLCCTSLEETVELQ